MYFVLRLTWGDVSQNKIETVVSEFVGVDVIGIRASVMRRRGEKKVSGEISSGKGRRVLERRVFAKVCDESKVSGRDVCSHPSSVRLKLWSREIGRKRFFIF